MAAPFECLLASPSASCHASTLESLDQLEQFETRWRALTRHGVGPIEQFDWIRCCAAHDRDGEKLSIAVVVEGERLLAAAPLVRSRRGGVLRDVALSVESHYEPMDFLAADATAMERLSQALAERREPLFLVRMPASSPAIAALQRAFAGRGLVLIRPQPASPFIALDASWSNPEAKLNAGRRSDFRRARRAAEALGTVASEILAPSLDTLDQLLDEAFAVESRSWKGDTGTAIVCDASAEAFYRDYARAACRAGVLRLGFLRIDGHAVAMQLAAVAGGGYWLLKIGFDAQFARISPGVLLLRESIAYAAECGLATFEFLGVPERWIDVWTEDKRPGVSLRVYPYNPRGAAALAFDVGAKVVKTGRETARCAAAKSWRVCRAGLKKTAMPVMKRLARNYIAGDSLADARRVCRRLAERRFLATVGFWDAASDKARAVATQYLAGLDALAEDRLGAYLSIKLPALRFSDKLLAEVAARAAASQTTLHFDALAPDTVDRTWKAIDLLREKTPGVSLRCTLSGRWPRSPVDARWAADRSLPVRVVKGQWIDPDASAKDPAQGFLETIDALAGNVPHVSVATHDPLLAAESMRRLQAAGTPCDLELLYGLPMRKSIALAHRLGVPVRIYVPYGEAYMPYTLSKIRENPHIVSWLMKDLLAAVFARKGY